MPLSSVKMKLTKLPSSCLFGELTTSPMTSALLPSYPSTPSYPTETWPSASAQARHHAGYASSDAYARYRL
jgi:hypothetical protein